MVKVWLDDIRDPPHGWTWVKSIEEAQELLKIGAVEDISLDNDLGTGFTEGRELVKWMVTEDVWPKNKPMVHSANVIANKYMKDMIERYYHEKEKETPT